MDVRLSPEQRALRDTAAQIVDRHGVHAVGQLDDRERAAKLDAAVETSGWWELRNASDGADPLASAVEAAIVAEQLGRGLADSAFLGPILAAELRRLGAAPTNRAGETVALVADLSTVAIAFDGRAFDARAFDARRAATALMLIPSADGFRIGEVEVPPAASTVDLTRHTAAIESAAAVTPITDQGRLLSEDDVAKWTALGLALTCADLVGTMQGAVQLARDYAVERKQYGAAIGSFQAVQHLLADAFVSMEGSRSVALHAAWAVDALPVSESLAASALAKAYCARAARQVCETAIQVHGGIGNTWECLAHVHLRRALASSDAFGGVGPNLARVLAHLQIGDDHGLR
jgi:alkylation response protein AidB-like acyl-CoA dehydrogenase